MTMTTVTVRVDTETKNAAAAVFERIGLDVSTAVRMFLKQTISRDRLPLDLSAPAPYEITADELQRRLDDVHAGRNLVVKSMDELEAMARD